MLRKTSVSHSLKLQGHSKGWNFAGSDQVGAISSGLTSPQSKEGEASLRTKRRQHPEPSHRIPQCSASLSHGVTKITFLPLKILLIGVSVQDAAGKCSKFSRLFANVLKCLQMFQMFQTFGNVPNVCRHLPPGWDPHPGQWTTSRRHRHPSPQDESRVRAGLPAAC